jgi:hypothetical protein
LACGPRVGMRAPVGLGWRRRSPGRGRREVGYDRWVPAVSLSGRGGRDAGWRQLLGQLGRLSCGARELAVQG